MQQHAGLNSLVGEVLNGVAFVMDYVEFSFNGPILRALVPPVVKVDGQDLRFPEQGSRDALCSMIGKGVKRIAAREDQAIEGEFDSRDQLIIPLAEAARVGREGAHFVPGLNQPIEVW